MLLIVAELAPLSSAHAIQGQDTRVPLTPGTLGRGELVFHILTQEDPKRGDKCWGVPLGTEAEVPALSPSPAAVPPQTQDPPAPLAKQEEEDTEDDAGDSDVDADDNACGGCMVGDIFLPAVTWGTQC